ncbi:MAG: hypothetical protein NHG36_17320 [Chromatiaceae bacterium]|nr:hypothetical protein [Candidatus Thioaporhodococcus sediminis]
MGNLDTAQLKAMASAEGLTLKRTSDAHWVLLDSAGEELIHPITLEELADRARNFASYLRGLSQLPTLAQMKAKPTRTSRPPAPRPSKPERAAPQTSVLERLSEELSLEPSVTRRRLRKAGYSAPYADYELLLAALRKS